jgi:uncharacterized protein (DUF58 family)
VHTSDPMKRLLLLTVVLAAVVAAPGGLARSHPTISVTRMVPITVAGTGFKAGERVKVVVRIPAVYRKTVTASRRGRFTATFRIASGKCIAVRALATGNEGSRATAYVPPSCRI